MAAAFMPLPQLSGHHNLSVALNLQQSLQFTEGVFFPGCTAHYLSQGTNSALPLDSHHSPETPPQHLWGLIQELKTSHTTGI